jgi:hypothetical protein
VKLSKGAWINAADGRFAYVDEHCNWAKRPGNLESLGLPTSVWESIRDIPNDYGGQNRESILRTVMSAGLIRMRCHSVFVTFEFAFAPEVVLLACRDVLREIAGDLTRCRFNNLATNETAEMTYANFISAMENLTSLDWQTS